jgi:UDP-galactopyranose mutase
MVESVPVPLRAALSRSILPVDAVALPASPFRSFWMGGFEGADHVNGAGVALDMARSSGHLRRLERDYAAAASLGLRTLRESVGWRLTEPAPGRFELARLRRTAAAARDADVQIVWTLMHYGTPADLDLQDDRLIERFADYAAAVARELKDADPSAVPIYNPINEIGFLSWAASETATFSPRPGAPSPDSEASSLRSGYAIKRRLARAALAAIDAIRAIDPRARFLHVEPLVHVVAPAGRPELQPLADQVAAYQWQAWDLIAGRIEPELGGSAAALDLLGVNHYHSGQWEVVTEERLHWHERDPRRRPFAEQLAAAWRRYGRPLLVAETSHFGAGRAAWLDEVAAEVAAAQRDGIPIEGLCLYPLVDRPDWNDAGHWHHSGLWDHDGDLDAPALVADYADALARCQRWLAPRPGSGTAPAPSHRTEVERKRA